MARIPQIIAQSNINSGPVAPYASPDAFGAQEGAAMAQLGESIAYAGQEAAKVANMLVLEKQRTKRRLEREEIMMHDRAFREAMVQWENDPQNAARTDYDSAFEEFARETRAEIAKGASSPFVRQEITKQFDSYSNQRKPHIMQSAERNRQQSFAVSMDNSIRSTMGQFRQQADPAAAAYSTEQVRQMLLQGVAESYDATAPTYAAKLKSHIDRQFIIGTAEKNPAYAQEVLAKSQNFDEETRAALQEHIGSINNRRMESLQFEFSQNRDEELSKAWRSGQMLPPVDQRSFEAVYGPKEGPRRFRTYEAERQELNRAVAYADEVRDLNPSVALAKVEKFRDDAKLSNRGYNLIATRVNESIKRIAGGDSAGWLAENNEHVRSAWSNFQSARPDQQADAFEKYAATVLRYSGSAPAGAHDADKYLNLPETNVLPLTIAKQWAAQLNTGKYEDKEQTLQAFASMIRNDEHASIAFRDLLTLPPQGQGVKREYVLPLSQVQFRDGQAYFADPEGVRAYLQAVDAKDELKALINTPQLQRDFEQAFETNAKWNQFRDLLLRKSPSNAEWLAAYQNGLTAYAYLTAKDNPSKAVSAAIDRFINRHHFIGSVNGEWLAISRYSPDGSVITDDQGEEMMRRLDMAIQTLDTDKMDLRPFPQFQQLQQDSPGVRLALLRQLSSSAHFEPNASGTGVYLHILSDGGTSTPLKDKSGKRFFIPLDTLPTFTHTETRGTRGPRPGVGGPTRQVEVREKPDGNLDAYTLPSWADPSGQLNWPVRTWKVNRSAKDEMLDTIKRNTKPDYSLEPRLMFVP